MDVRYTARLPIGVTDVLVPGGVATPHGACTAVEGPRLTTIHEANTGQRAFRTAPEGDEISIIFRFDRLQGEYPEAVFFPHQSRFTRFAADLVREVDAVRFDRTGLELARALACHVAERFTYGHPETTFNDGFDVIPALGCGLTEGSCVDINTYFIAALRAAGLEAGYITGFFFPEEKGGTCEDGHCWVVTRIDGAIHEWDIAHHLKMGTRDIQPGLNPRSGQRYACFHSMGLDFPSLGITGLKALIEPLSIVDGKVVKFEAPEIMLKDMASV